VSLRPTNGKSRLVVRGSRAKSVVYLPFAVFPLWLGLIFERDWPGLAWFTIGVLLVFLWLVNLISPKTLTLDRQGFTFSRPLCAARVVEWRDVERFDAIWVSRTPLTVLMWTGMRVEGDAHVFPSIWRRKFTQGVLGGFWELPSWQVRNTLSEWRDYFT